MDKLIINTKVESIIRCLKRVADRCSNNIEDFSLNIDAQDIVILNLSRAIQLNVDIAMHIIASSSQPIPQTMASAFDQLCKMKVIGLEMAENMKKLVGFRNIAIHNYDDVDMNIVFSIAHDHIGDFKQFIREIINYMDKTKHD